MTEQNSQADTKEIVVDHYRVIDKIASGGMGTVYRAYEPALDRHVAIKFLSRELCRDSQIVERFDREAKAAADLQHPNIVSVFFRGRVQGRPYFSMELIEGESLADKAKSGPLQPRYAISLMAQAAKGLGAAWRKKKLHRDVKPANLMVTTDNILKITDFGLAKALDSDSGGLTSANIVVGTPHFISPEQAQGLPVDCRADIYSLGATFYFLLSGNLPFEADTAMAVLVKHINDPLPSLHDLRPELPTALCATIERMMAKSADDRFQDYDELTSHLEAIYSLMPKDFDLPSDVNIPMASSGQPNTMHALERPPEETANDETQAGLPTPLSQPSAQAPTLHSQKAPVVQPEQVAAAEEAGPAAKIKKRWFIAVAAFILFLIIAGKVAKKKKLKQLTLTQLPPVTEQKDRELGFKRLGHRIEAPTPLVNVRALVEFTSSYANLPGAIERVGEKSDERIYIDKFKTSHAWSSATFSENHISMSLRLLKALKVDVQKNMRLFDKLHGVEQGILFTSLRLPPRMNNYKVLRQSLLGDVTKYPPQEKWRQVQIDKILKELPETPQNLLQLRQSFYLLSVLARVAKIDLRWSMKRCLHLRSQLEKEQFQRWELVENALAHVQYTGFRLLRGCPRNTIYRQSLIAIISGISNAMVGHMVNIDEATKFAVKSTQKLSRFAEQAGLPLRDYLPKELGDYPDLRDKEMTIKYLHRFPPFSPELVSKIIIPTVAVVEESPFQQRPKNPGDVHFRPLREIRMRRLERRKRRRGF